MLGQVSPRMWADRKSAMTGAIHVVLMRHCTNPSTPVPGNFDVSNRANTDSMAYRDYTDPIGSTTLDLRSNNRISIISH